MKTITIENITYDIEPDHNGDILLMSPKQDVIIRSGRVDLERNAIDNVGIEIAGELEYDRTDVDYYVEEHLMDFIRDNFSTGEVTLNENVEDLPKSETAVDDVLAALIPEKTLSKLVLALALNKEEFGADEDLTLFAEQANRALERKAMHQLPY